MYARLSSVMGCVSWARAAHHPLQKRSTQPSASSNAEAGAGVMDVQEPEEAQEQPAGHVPIAARPDMMLTRSCQGCRGPPPGRCACGTRAALRPHRALDPQTEVKIACS